MLLIIFAHNSTPPNVLKGKRSLCYIQTNLAFTSVQIICDDFLPLFQVPYRLHAVLVHEGQANAGHYWAYIYDPQHSCWMKYNDISVTKSSWEELVRDSFGGYRNASAYCLMYINDKKSFLVQGSFTKAYRHLM